MAGTYSVRLLFSIMEQSIILKNGLCLYVDSMEQPSIAPWLLAHFSSIKGKQSLLELCSGNGASSFWCIDNGFSGDTVLLDRRESVLRLAEKTIEYNSLSNVRTCCSTLEQYRADKKYDVVICNHPFFSEAFTSEDDDIRAIRHEEGLTLDQLCGVVSKAIKQRGHFYLCHIPSRLIDVLKALDDKKFEIKGIRFCRDTSGALPFLVLIDAVFMGGKGVTIYPDFVVKDSSGHYTEEMKELCERKGI